MFYLALRDERCAATLRRFPVLLEAPVTHGTLNDISLGLAHSPNGSGEPTREQGPNGKVEQVFVMFDFPSS